MTEQDGAGKVDAGQAMVLARIADDRPDRIFNQIRRRVTVNTIMRPVRAWSSRLLIEFLDGK